jgi:hypothetical protein
MLLIGFIGKMGSGKTTAADYCVDSYGFTKHNFKDALDKELAMLYPTVISKLSNDWPDVEMALKVKPTPDAIRELKQKHGTDVRRAQDQQYWVKKWMDYYMGFTSDARICADDVRFLNEVEAIKNMGGIIVRIKRDDVVDTGTHAGGAHISETELDNYEADVTVVAEQGDFSMLHRSLDSIIENDNDYRNGKEDGDDRGAYDEYAETSTS